MRPLRDDDPPGTRVSVLDRTLGGGCRFLAVLAGMRDVPGHGAEVRLRRLYGWTHIKVPSADCLVLEEGDEP